MQCWEQVNQSDSMVAFPLMTDELIINIIFGCCLKNESNSKGLNVLRHTQLNSGSEAIYAKLHPFTCAGEQNSNIKNDDFNPYIKLRELINANEHVDN